MPIREQHRIPPSSSESLKVAGTCDVCGQVYQGHPNRHAMCEGKAAAPQAEARVCRVDCGKETRDAKWPCKQWGSAECFRPAFGKDQYRCFCTLGCRAAGRPLNPAPKVQPVPTGYRLGENWRLSGGALSLTCGRCNVTNATGYRAPTGSLWRFCTFHAVEIGALVPIEPTAAPSKCMYCGVALGPIAIPAGDGLAYCSGACPGICGTPTAAPEGQQGEAKASEPGWCGNAGACVLVAGHKGPCDYADESTRQLIWDNPPAAPAKAREPGKVPLSELARGIVGAEIRPWLVDGIAALEVELAKAKRESAGRDAALIAITADYDDARAEVERLCKKLAEVEDSFRVANRAHGTEATEAHEKWKREADAREAAMRAAAAKVARDRGAEFTAQAIERLPLSTGDEKQRSTHHVLVEPFVDHGSGRCEVCGWTLTETPEQGCVAGDCSFRPDAPSERQKLSERRRQLAQAKRNDKSQPDAIKAAPVTAGGGK